MASKNKTRLPKPQLFPWLLLLLRINPTYGYGLRQDLLGRGFDADPSSVYRCLREMDGQGLIASTWTDKSEGPPRRVYELTEAGVIELDRVAVEWQRNRNIQTGFLRAFMRERM